MINEINPLDHIDHIGALLAEHWAETGLEFDLVPNVDLYASARESGRLVCHGAFSGDEMVGYAVGLLSPHLHNPAVTICACTALFMRKGHRGGVMSARLVAETERIAAERGADYVMWMTDARTDLCETFAAHGYARADVSMIKRLQ